MGISSLMVVVMEMALTTSNLGFVYRMILPITWNVVGEILKFAEDLKVCTFHLVLVLKKINKTRKCNLRTCLIM
jgi:hypothetical protein